VNLLGATRIRGALQGTPKFINLILTGNQTNINTNTEVAYTLGSASGLSVNANRVSLKAGVTYVLFATLRHLGSVGNTAADYIWRDYTNSVNLGKHANSASNNNTSNDGTTPSMTVIIKPTTDIDVGVICLAVSAANQGLGSDTTQASIHSLPEF